MPRISPSKQNQSEYKYNGLTRDQWIAEGRKYYADNGSLKGWKNSNWYDKTGTGFLLTSKTRKGQPKPADGSSYSPKTLKAQKTQTDNRNRYALLSTPLDSDMAAGKAVFDANKGNTGTDVDHIQRLERTGKALQEMNLKRQAKYHANYAEANIPIGNDPKNLEVVSRGYNRSTDALEHRAIDDKLGSMEKQQRSPTLVQLEQTGTTSKNRRLNFAKGVGTWVPQQGWEEQLAAPRTIDTDPLGGMGLPISGV